MNAPKKSPWFEYDKQNKTWTLRDREGVWATIKTREISSRKEIYDVYPRGTKVGYLSFKPMKGEGIELARRMIMATRMILSPHQIRIFARHGLTGIFGVTQTESYIRHCLEQYPTLAVPGDRLWEAEAAMLGDMYTHLLSGRKKPHERKAKTITIPVKEIPVHVDLEPFPFRFQPMRALFFDFFTINHARTLPPSQRDAIIALYRRASRAWRTDLTPNRGPLNFAEFSKKHFGRIIRKNTVPRPNSTSPHPKRRRRT